MPLPPEDMRKPKVSVQPMKPPPRPQTLQFGKPERRDWIAMAFFWVFVIGGIGISVWLLNRSPRLHGLDCETGNGMNSLTGFGRCHESTTD